ncbi:MAG: ATP-dependent metallopeptidase FtsH/Yme1/Tma family protein [Parcubacteria group bacterium]|nr:ATP-dependent metallopeptidase FtsH/Yme1/Tma family protein [Parcubacteria group bacterium]
MEVVMNKLVTLTNRANRSFVRFTEKYPRLFKTILTVLIGGPLLWFLLPIKADDVRGPILMTLFMLAVFWLMFRLQRKSLGAGKRSGGLRREENVTTRFNDVAGCDEAKREVMEIVEFLTNPAKFAAVNAVVPSGALLIGDPGNGKTLMAKAIAGEAKVPFFSISGSDFVEVFVGIGARRVREVFETARKAAPCILFIDEIDAVGKKRGSSGGDGGEREHEQTLNMLLTELQGMRSDPTKPVVVIAATNRPDVLDPALIRPGRLTRHIEIGNQPTKGREAILKVHMAKIPIAKDDVDLKRLAHTTAGYSGADLANLVNEAAIVAAREGETLVHMSHFEKAKDRVIFGTDNGKRMSDEERQIVAYHESGHAVVGELQSVLDPVTHVSVSPRRNWLGVTISIPTEDRYITSKSKLLARIAMAFGGRLAEEIFVGNINSGANGDYASATAVARDMVTRLGMGDPAKFSQRVYGDDESELTKRLIDKEVDRIVTEQYAFARQLLESNRDKVEAMTALLLEEDTISIREINKIMRGNAEADKPKVTVH